MRLTRPLRIASVVAGLLILLALGTFLVWLISPSLENRGPVAPNQSVLAPSSANAQNSVWAYMASHGYRGDAIGHPLLQGGGNDPDTVIILMPIQSPDFRIGQSVLTDPDTQKQISMAFTAMSNFYPSIARYGVGLEYGDYIQLYRVAARNVLDVTQGRLSLEAFWSRVESQTSLLDAQTWAPVYDKDFLSKDFSGSSKVSRVLPPNAEPASRGRGQIVAQPSSAYLPTGEELIIVGTAISNTGILASGRQMEFSYSAGDGDPQVFSTSTTDADGAGRARFTPPSGVTNSAILSVSAGDVAASALAPVTFGPVPTESDAPGVVTSSLALQGYNVLSVEHDTTNREASALAEMVVPRFDRRARGQILTMAGTLFTVYPTIEAAKPVLLYRHGGNSYKLLFRINRQDWQAWLDGATNEATLWDEIDLSQIVDVQSGRLVNQRDFFDKDFAAVSNRTDVATRKYVDGSLTTETWGEQLNPGLIKVPIGGFALSFAVEQITSGAGFAIYNVVDPVNPVYDSAADPSGGQLGTLRLTNGQYLVSITTGAPPSSVRLSYTEHLLNSLSATP